MDFIKSRSGSESVLQPYLAHVSTQQKKGFSQSVREFFCMLWSVLCGRRSLCHRKIAVVHEKTDVPFNVNKKIRCRSKKQGFFVQNTHARGPVSSQFIKDLLIENTLKKTEGRIDDIAVLCCIFNIESYEFVRLLIEIKGNSTDSNVAGIANQTVTELIDRIINQSESLTPRSENLQQLLLNSRNNVESFGEVLKEIMHNGHDQILDDAYYYLGYPESKVVSNHVASLRKNIEWSSVAPGIPSVDPGTPSVDPGTSSVDHGALSVDHGIPSVDSATPTSPGDEIPVQRQVISRGNVKKSIKSVIHASKVVTNCFARKGFDEEQLKRWISGVPLDSAGGYCHESLLVLASALNIDLEYFVTLMEKMKETDGNVTNREINKLKEYIARADNLVGDDDQSAYNSNIHIARVSQAFDNNLEWDLLYYIGVTKSLKKVLPLSNDNSFDDKDSHVMIIRFQQGNLTNKDVFCDCNVMFNPSNTGLGTVFAGGAEGAIRNAVGEEVFKKANKVLLNNKWAVDDGFVGVTREIGNLGERGIELLVHQVAPIAPIAPIAPNEEDGDVYSKAYELLVDTWAKAFEASVVNLPDGTKAKIASTSLGAGIFRWTATESLTAARIALLRLPKNITSRIASLLIIDPLNPNGRGASRGCAVYDAFDSVFS